MISELFEVWCKLESAQAVVHLRGHSETAVWHHCLKIDLRTFRHHEKLFYKYVII